MKRYYIYLLIILGVTFAVYSPSILHLFRGETYSYFLDKQGYGFMVGEPLLFRPFLSGMFDLQYAVFGVNPVPWHVLAILMQCLASFALFRLLWTIKPNLLALLVTLFFSTMYLTINAILYTVITPYCIVIALVLSSLYWLYSGIKYNKRKYIYFAFAVIAIACFFYEVIIFFAIIMALYVWIEREHLIFKWQQALIPCIVLVVAYFSLYAHHIVSNLYLASGQARDVFSMTGILIGLKSSFYIAGNWIAGIFMPSAFVLIPITKLQVQSVGFGSNMFMPLIILNIVALFVIVYLVYNKGKRSPFLLIVGLMMVAYLLIVSVFRSYTIGIDYILATNIDANMFLALGIVLIYKWFLSGDIQGRSYKVVALIVVFVTLISGVKTFQANYQVLKKEQPMREWLKTNGDVVPPQFGEDLNIRLYMVGEGGKQYPHDYTVPQILNYQEWTKK